MLSSAPLRRIQRIVPWRTHARKRRLEPAQRRGFVSASFLANEGYDPDYGARPLKRTMQRLVLDPLSERPVASQLTQGGDLKKGDEVTVIVKGGAIDFRAG